MDKEIITLEETLIKAKTLDLAVREGDLTEQRCIELIEEVKRTRKKDSNFNSNSPRR